MDVDIKKLLSIGYEACQILDQADVPHMVGGGIAVWAYGRRRPTKDIDIFIPSSMPHRAMDALAKEGYHTRETDAGWLYKAFKEDIMVDLIVWTTGKIKVDEETIAHRRFYTIEGHQFHMMGPEDVLYRKIFSHNEERRDWYDGLSMLRHPVPDFDWDYFLKRSANQSLNRTASFILYALDEMGSEVVPKTVVDSLIAQLCRKSS